MLKDHDVKPASEVRPALLPLVISHPGMTAGALSRVEPVGDRPVSSP
jgi:hypothetical protein